MFFRLLILIAVIVLPIETARPAEQSLGQALKKAFSTPTPTPKPRKKTATTATKKKIADHRSNSLEEIIAGSRRKFTDSVGVAFAEEEEVKTRRRRIAIRYNQEKEKFPNSNAVADGVTASKKERFASAGTVGLSD